MSIVIRGWAPAYPGVNGVKGNALNTTELLNLTIGKDGGRLAKRIARTIEEKSGIRLRNVIDPTLEDPNTYLASAAAHKLLRKLDMKPSQVEGFIFASNTPDYVFPPPGLPIIQSLELNPLENDYKATACSSFIGAVDEAVDWIEKGRVKNVLVVACDITTRLCLPNNFVERLLFGDGAIAVLIEAGGPEDKGGFILTNRRSIPEAADLVQHRNYFSFDIQQRLAKHNLVGANDNGSKGTGITPEQILLADHHLNDDGYALLGSIDGREWAYTYLDYKHKTKTVPDKIIPPQIGNTVILKGVSVIKDIDGENLTEKIIDGSFRNHGNTGAAAFPIAWYEGITSTQIKSNESVGAPFVPLGGRSGYFAYDPNLDHAFEYVKIEEHERVPRDDYGKLKDEKLKRLQAEKHQGDKYLARLGLPMVRPTQPHPDGDYVGRVQDAIAPLSFVDS